MVYKQILSVVPFMVLHLDKLNLKMIENEFNCTNTVLFGLQSIGAMRMMKV